MTDHTIMHTMTKAMSTIIGATIATTTIDPLSMNLTIQKKVCGTDSIKLCNAYTKYEESLKEEKIMEEELERKKRKRVENENICKKIACEIMIDDPFVFMNMMDGDGGRVMMKKQKQQDEEEGMEQEEDKGRKGCESSLSGKDEVGERKRCKVEEIESDEY